MCNVSGKKDPGIPNHFPFKEEILKEAEKRKQQVKMLVFLTFHVRNLFSRDGFCIIFHVLFFVYLLLYSYYDLVSISRYFCNSY